MAGIHTVIGRPTRYDPELADQILKRIAEGELLCDICADPDMPPSRTVRGWAMEPPKGAESFPTLYARAREHWCDAMVEKALAKSMDGSGDRIPTEYGDKPDTARVQRDRLIVDTVKWMASKIYRRQYGEDGLFAGLAAAAGSGAGVKITIETVGSPAIEPRTVDGKAEEVG